MLPEPSQLKFRPLNVTMMSADGPPEVKVAVGFCPTVMNFVPGNDSWRKSPSLGTPEAALKREELIR